MLVRSRGRAFAGGGDEVRLGAAIECPRACRSPTAWSRDVAGAREHGTTRLVPRETYHLIMAEEPYRAPMTVEPDPYVVLWAKLRRRRRMLVRAASVASIAVTILGTMTIGVLALLVVPLLIPLWALVWAQASRFPCPHCGETFGPRDGWLLGRGLHRNCVRCGIEIGTPKSSVDAIQ